MADIHEQGTPAKQMLRGWVRVAGVPVLHKFVDSESVYLFIPCHMIVAGYYGITLAVRVSCHLTYACPSIFSFLDDNLVNVNGFSPNGVCIDIVEIWFGIVMQISSIFDKVICQQHVCIFISG